MRQAHRLSARLCLYKKPLLCPNRPSNAQSTFLTQYCILRTKNAHSVLRQHTQPTSSSSPKSFRGSLRRSSTVIFQPLVPKTFSRQLFVDWNRSRCVNTLSSGPPRSRAESTSPPRCEGATQFRSFSKVRQPEARSYGSEEVSVLTIY